MPILELTSGEAELIRVARLTPAQRAAERQARADAILAKARERMKADDLAAFDAERERVAKLSPTERRAEALVSQKALIEKELTKPEIAAVVSTMSDGKCASEREA